MAKKQEKISVAKKAPTVAHVELEEDDDIHNESFMDRLRALSDIFPQHSRENLVKKLSGISQQVMAAGYIVGKIAWILSTSAMILLLPLEFEQQRESAMLAYEQEQMLHQKALNPSGGSSGFNSPGSSLPQPQK